MDISKSVIKDNSDRLDILFYFNDSTTAWNLLTRHLPTGMIRGYFKERKLIRMLKNNGDVRGDTTVAELKQIALQRIKDHGGEYKISVVWRG